MASLLKQLNKCLKRRERLFVRIQLCFDLLKELPAKKNVFVARCSELSQLYTEFETVSVEIDDINISIEKPEERYDTSAPSKQFDIMYFEIKAAYDLILAEKTVSLTIAESEPIVKPRLPQIDISKFGGQLEQFNSFKSLYDNLIHNSVITPIEKFSYLKSLLEGPALNVVEGIPFDPDHYQLAYDTLVERYTNPRILGSYYLNKILDQQPIKSPNLYNLRQIVDVFHINVQALKNLNIQDMSGFVFLNLALRLLDSTTRKAFELENKSVRFPTIDSLLEFLRAQCAVYELTKDSSKHLVISKQPSSSTRKALFTSQQVHDKLKTNPTQSQSAVKCPLCKGDHQLYRCEQFIALNTNERLDTVRSIKRCFSCLGSHMLPACLSNSSCRYCKSKKHHSLLHASNQSTVLKKSSFEPPLELNTTNHPPTEKSSASTSVSSFEKPAQSLSCGLNNPKVNNMAILSTAQVLIQDPLGKWQTCRAVIDGGSQVNFVTRSLVESLKLPLEKCSLNVTGIGQSSQLTAKGLTTCKISSRYHRENCLKISAVVIPQISSDIPATPLSASLKNKFSSLSLADPDFHRPAKVDMLLGAQAFTDILSTEGLSFIKGQPSALHTIFGWVLMGDVPSNMSSESMNSLLVSSLRTDHLLQQFWEMEEINFPKPLSPEDQACEEHYRSTIKREESGRYVASLPFKSATHPDLGFNRGTALRKYNQLENKFNCKPDFREKYVANMEDYIQKGHLVLVSQPSSYVLTHHGVFKETSTSSPLRIVFNASELSNTNHSLNSSLMVGPKLQTDIGTIITNFRLHPIALTCDIKQMYRAISLSPEDCKYQHIFWRANHTDPIQEWELQRLTFGVSCSPFIAQRTLKQLVMDEGSKYPQASEVLSSSCYIDDIVCGVSSESEAQNLYRELNQLLNSGGFELHKWSTSSTAVLQIIPEECRETPHSLGSTNSIKILGLQWDPSSDCFRYSINCVDNTATKRNVLSQVARVYDVNGYISPCVFTLKHLLQQIWIEKLDWDDDLPGHLKTKWIKFIQDLPQLTKLCIPRFILSTYISVQLIGFSDASKIGMCATLYLRIICVDQTIQCNLIQSKTKVAPLKPLTIPRLELCAALLLSRLVEANKQLLNRLAIKDIFLFSDSMNVLGWINTPPHLLETFVSNRVCKILENTTAGIWHHVAGDQNPADYGTRGLLPSQLLNISQWWHGPPFMYNDETSWQISPCVIPHDLPVLEMEPKSTTLTSQIIPQKDLCNWMERFSSLTKLQNVMGFVLRFINNLRHSTQRSYGPLTLQERNESLTTCVRIVQKCFYSEEIKLLKKGKQCSSSLRNLSPFLYKDILMVGGRLHYAPLPQTSRHPLLIPSKSHFAKLLCNYYHLNTLHGGPKLVQSLLQRRYWIPGARSLIRKQIFKCLPCYKLKAKPMQPYMADLPPSRFRQGRCFENVGLDFAGPFLFKESTRRNARLSKCYIALFVCMSVKAVHLELVLSLTTESCLAAIDRFIARRGLPRNIFSDQGRNFVGAARQLQEIYQLLKTSNTQFMNHLAKQEIIWNFNPPYAANFGGLWEAGIKSTKHHLKRILDTHHFTAEEFYTFLCRIEAVLNSRPLCPVSTSPDDGFDYLSPGHFLIGAQLLARPEEDTTQEPLKLLSRWKLISSATQVFWNKWSKEYIHSQIQRPKWTTKTPNVKVGDLVLMYSTNMPPLSWPLGRIVQIFPGRDNVVRVVNVRTPNGIVLRPVNKLIALPNT